MRITTVEVFRHADGRSDDQVAGFSGSFWEDRMAISPHGDDCDRSQGGSYAKEQEPLSEGKENQSAYSARNHAGKNFIQHAFEPPLQPVSKTVIVSVIVG